MYKCSSEEEIAMIRRIAVCDDEWEARQQLCLYLKRLQQESGDRYEIFYFSSAEALLAEMPRDMHVILLDIQMKQASGIDAARALRAEGLDVHLIFITNNPAYALEGYDVHAYAFLRKPLLYEALKRHLTDAFAQIDQRSGGVISMPTSSGVDIIHCSDLLYVEVLRHQTTFVTVSGSSDYICSLNAIEERIRRFGFFRCHKSYLINLRRIVRVTADNVVMEGDHVVPLSKYRRKELLEQIAGFIGAQL